MADKREPLGTFRAKSTRDGAARARDGHPYYAMHRVQETLPADPVKTLWDRGGELYEVQFGDGAWMLVRAVDLATGSVGLGTSG